MACTSLKRRQPLESLWDHCVHKVVGIAVEGQGIGNGKASTFCKINYGKKKRKLRVARKSSEPVWNDMFYLEPEEKDVMKVEVWEDRLLSTYFIGEVVLGTVARLAKEMVIDEWYDLVGKNGDGNLGRVHLRMYYSTMPLSAPEKGNQHIFTYQDVKSSIKPGDLIGYSGTGILAASTKLWSNCEFSSVGVVIELPNKWNDDLELYVAEVDRSRGVRAIDALQERYKDGICIFKLFERIHAFHGKAIWWIPLKEALAPDSRLELTQYVLRAHSDTVPFLHQLDLPVLDLLRSAGLAKDQSDFIELYGSYFAASAVKRMTRNEVKFSAKTVTPRDIATLSIYDWPVPIRRMSSASVLAPTIVYGVFQDDTAGLNGGSAYATAQAIVEFSDDAGAASPVSSARGLRLTSSEPVVGRSPRKLETAEQTAEDAESSVSCSSFPEEAHAPDMVGSSDRYITRQQGGQARREGGPGQRARDSDELQPPVNSNESEVILQQRMLLEQQQQQLNELRREMLNLRPRPAVPAPEAKALPAVPTPEAKAEPAVPTPEAKAVRSAQKAAPPALTLQQEQLQQQILMQQRQMAALLQQQQQLAMANP